MELMIKMTALAVVAIACALLIKRTNPEIALLISVSAMIMIFTSGLYYSNGLKSLRQAVHQFCGDDEFYIGLILKCLGISLVTKIGSDICKDSGQTAVASSLEFSGTLCALTIAVPLLTNVLNVVGGIQ